MTELEGLATLLVRLAGGYYLVQAVLQLVFSVGWLLSKDQSRIGPGLTDSLLGATIYLLLAAALMFSGRRLGRLLAKGLE